MPTTGYSAALISLVGGMLSHDPNNRPNASEILRSSPIRDYVSTALCILLFLYLLFHILTMTRDNYATHRRNLRGARGYAYLPPLFGGGTVLPLFGRMTEKITATFPQHM